MLELDVYASRLKWFKQRERPEVILLVADHPHLTRVAAAWPGLAVARSEPLSPLANDSECAVWDWLWENTRYSRRELATLSSVCEDRLNGLLSTLIGNRVLYPDATLNAYVQRYLKGKVLNLFEAKPRRTAKR